MYTDCIHCVSYHLRLGGITSTCMCGWVGGCVCIYTVQSVEESEKKNNGNQTGIHKNSESRLRDEKRFLRWMPSDYV